ncbi:hypothetical protein G6O69_15105 [Pseudenhygromyxa sp. WMMC2535]|uniref:JmjC domain-containing protein n=1 Tax=Pseudenhygromyxa sp. WMMC2535 TaxID=2712867 RepID=UPI0015533C42|nr:cupin domain-containing protein [Pseudenhygromyxa sp. WMMC2535]NVB39169.1 hypothetical protein [Pseudenhygromyxa sp. WMMC2535]
MPELLEQAAVQMYAVFEAGEPAVLRGLGPLFEVEEVFAWIKRVHPQAKASSARDKIDAVKRSWGLDIEPPLASADPDPGRPAEIYRAGAMILEPAPFLPRPEHDSFEAWVRETHEALGGSFGMQAPGLECASLDALGRLQALLGPVLAETGPRSYRYNAFVGDYARTPFGYHVDPHQEGVFQYVLSGSRRAHFWQGLILQDADAEWVEDANGLAEPRIPPEHSFSLEPGDLVFWPGTHVHGFEPDGPSMALSMVIDRASPLSRAEVVRALEVATMGGTAALPAVDEFAAPVDPGARLVRRAGIRLAHARWEDALIIGVCGRSFEWPERSSAAAAAALIDDLEQTRGVIEVDAILGRHAHPPLAAVDILEVLTVLVSLGAYA